MAVINIIYLVLGIHGIVLALLLYLKRNTNAGAKKTLAILVLVFSLSLMMQNAAHSVFDYHHRPSAPLIVLIFLFGPVFLLYVNELTRTGKFRSFLPHLVPFITAVIIYVPVILFVHDPDIFMKFKLLVSFVSLIHITGYLIVAVISIRLYSKTILDNFSDIARMNVYWLYFLTGMYALAWTVFLILRVFYPDPAYNGFFWMLICLITYIIGCFTLNQPGTVLGSTEDTFQEHSGKNKYRKSSLSDEQMSDLADRIRTVFEHEKIYLDSQITLSALSEKISVSTHHLSQVINVKFGKNFYDLINSYRIGDARTKLLNSENENLTVLDIALESGYNSLSTFNAAFRKYTGVTPSSLRRNKF